MPDDEMIAVKNERTVTDYPVLVNFETHRMIGRLSLDTEWLRESGGVSLKSVFVVAGTVTNGRFELLSISLMSDDAYDAYLQEMRLIAPARRAGCAEVKT